MEIFFDMGKEPQMAGSTGKAFLKIFSEVQSVYIFFNNGA